MNVAAILIECVRSAISGLRALASSLEAGLHNYEASLASGHLDLDIEAQGPLDTDSRVWAFCGARSIASVPSSVARGSDASESYRLVEATLSRAPGYCTDLCRALQGSPDEVARRVQRAWEAGLWSKALSKVRFQNQDLHLRSLNGPLVTSWFVLLVLALLVGLPQPVSSSELCLASPTTPSLTPSPVLQKERCSVLPWELPSQSRNDDFEYHREGPTGFVCARLAFAGRQQSSSCDSSSWLRNSGDQQGGRSALGSALGFSAARGFGGRFECNSRHSFGTFNDGRGACSGGGRCWGGSRVGVDHGRLVGGLPSRCREGPYRVRPGAQDNRDPTFLARCSADLLPSSSSLLNAALEWSHTEVDTRVHFYSAEEEVPPLEETQFKKPTPKRSVAPLPALPTSSTTKEVPKPKKVTTAALAEQVASLASSIPALLSQVQQISDQQQRMGEAQSAAKIPAYRQPFASPAPTDPGGLKAFTAMVGQAPPGRGTPLLNTPKPTTLLEEPQMAPHEEGFPAQGEAAGDVTTALAQQTQAMTALVAHLVGQSDLSELTSGSTSSALTSKGSVKREKLQNDLAERRSNYMLQVAQLASGRMKPSEPVPIPVWQSCSASRPSRSTCPSMEAMQARRNWVTWLGW